MFKKKGRKTLFVLIWLAQIDLKRQTRRAREHANREKREKR